MELGASQLILNNFDFEQNLMIISCTTISTMDNGISEGTRSAHIVISEGTIITVPIGLFPNRIPLTILDNGK